MTRLHREGRILGAGLLIGIGVLLAISSCTRGPVMPKQPNVILILVDTLRADRLGVYGYDKKITPSIDFFASRATLYENAISQAPHTLPSVLQIMTSKHLQGKHLSPQDETLARILDAAGYETVAIVENPHFEHEFDAHGLANGFDYFFRNGLLQRDNIEQQLWKSNTPADAITAQAKRWLRKRDATHPFFMWLHYFDPHDPYMPPYAQDMESLSWNTASRFTGDIRNTFLFRPSRAGDPDSFTDADQQHISNLYDAEVRYLDQSLGELFEFLRARELLEDSLIILSADHGESLGEHDTWFHGRTLFDSEIHIPLLIKYPFQKTGVRVAAPAQSIDIFPTVLDTVGIEIEGSVDGQSLRERRSRPAFAYWNEWQVVRESKWKLIQRGQEILLFDIEADPKETIDISQEKPAVVRRLLTESTNRLREIEATAEELHSLSREEVERLRSLGYLN